MEDGIHIKGHDLRFPWEFDHSTTKPKVKGSAMMTMGNQGKLNMELMDSGYIDARNETLKNQIGKHTNVVVVHIPNDLALPICYQAEPGIELEGADLSTVYFDSPQLFVSAITGLPRIHPIFSQRIDDKLKNASLMSLMRDIYMVTNKSQNSRKYNEILQGLMMVIGGLEYKDLNNPYQISSMSRNILQLGDDHYTDMISAIFAKKFISGLKNGLTKENAIKNGISGLMHMY